jgi:hypothetical protein
VNRIGHLTTLARVGAGGNVLRDPTFRYVHPLDGDVIVIDETSVLDTTLAWQLLRVTNSCSPLSTKSAIRMRLP